MKKQYILCVLAIISILIVFSFNKKAVYREVMVTKNSKKCKCCEECNNKKIGISSWCNWSCHMLPDDSPLRNV